MITRQEFFKWLDTCPSNWDEDGNRTANPTFEIINDDFENTTIRFVYDEEMIEEEEEEDTDPPAAEEECAFDWTRKGCVDCDD